MIGRGQGLITTPEGQVVPWTGTGVGKRRPDGTIAYQASIILEPSATKLDELSQPRLQASFEAEPDGSVETTLTRIV